MTAPATIEPERDHGELAEAIAHDQRRARQPSEPHAAAVRRA